MTSPRDPNPEKETVFIYDMSPELEAELLRRANEKGKDPATEAAEILENHASGDGETE